MRVGSYTAAANSVLKLVVLTMLFGAGLNAQDQFFDSHGVPIRYVEGGQGQTVILVHGMLGNIEGAWLETGVFTNLSRDYHVVAFDLRAHGKSGKPRDASGYGQEMVEDIFRLLDHLKIPKAHIVGYSLGAMLTAKAIADHEDRFLTVTLGGATPIVGVWTADRRQRNDERALEYEKSGQAFADIFRSYPALTVTETQIKNIGIPLLAVVGSEDPAIENVRGLKRLLPNLDLVVIDRATHAGPQRAHGRPEFVEAIRTFISSHPSSNP